MEVTALLSSNTKGLIKAIVLVYLARFDDTFWFGCTRARGFRGSSFLLQESRKSHYLTEKLQSTVTMSASEREGLRSATDDANDQVYSPPETDIKTSGGLKKNVTLANGIGLIVGSIIGSGIFISPTSVLTNTGSIGLSLIVWFLCGAISFLGALCYSELGTTIPKSGGEYSYLYDIFGPIPAFLFSWTAVLVIRPAAVAGIAVVFGEYAVKPFYEGCDPPVYLIKLLAFVCIGKYGFVLNGFEIHPL